MILQIGDNLLSHGAITGVPSCSSSTREGYAAGGNHEKILPRHCPGGVSVLPVRREKRDACS